MVNDPKGFDEDTSYDKMIVSVLQGEKKDYPTLMRGLQVASGNDFAVWSPVDDSIRFGLFQEPEEGITDDMVKASQESFKTWSKTSVESRIEIFSTILERIKAQRLRLAAVVTISSGMARVEAIAEVDTLIEVISQALEDLPTAKGKPGGVWAVISAHNSPLASPIGFAAVAMMAGNAVIVMPDKLCPVPIYEMYNLFEKAGLPGGVLNVLVDRKFSTTNKLANNTDLKGVVASGSGKRLEDLMFLMIDDELSFINEIKGMNPILVYKPSKVKEAARNAMESFFAYSGQRLYSTSKVVVMAEEQSAFINAAIEFAKDMEVGDPAEKSSFTGPIISQDALAMFSKILDNYRDKLVFGGKQIKNEMTQGGYYVSPAIIMGLDEDDELNYIDTGLPILIVQTATSLDNAMELMIQTECGLSAGIYSKDTTAVEMFKESVPVDVHFVNEGSRFIPAARRAKISEFLV